MEMRRRLAKGVDTTLLGSSGNRGHYAPVIDRKALSAIAIIALVVVWMRSGAMAGDVIVLEAIKDKARATAGDAFLADVCNLDISRVPSKAQIMMDGRRHGLNDGELSEIAETYENESDRLYEEYRSARREGGFINCKRPRENEKWRTLKELGKESAKNAAKCPNSSCSTDTARWWMCKPCSVCCKPGQGAECTMGGSVCTDGDCKCTHQPECRCLQ